MGRYGQGKDVAETTPWAIPPVSRTLHALVIGGRMHTIVPGCLSVRMHLLRVRQEPRARLCKLRIAVPHAPLPQIWSREAHVALAVQHGSEV